MHSDDAEQEARETIGTNISLAMDERGIAPRELATAVEATESQVSNWRRGRIRPSAKYMKRLALTLGHSQGWFLDPHDEPTTPRRRKRT